MSLKIAGFLLSSALSLSKLAFAADAAGKTGWNYPSAPRGSLVETLHGKKVADPYRWLETSGSKETQSWLTAQRSLAAGYLDTLDARRKSLATEIEAVQDYERFQSFEYAAGKVFYLYNSGLEAVSSLMFADIAASDRKGERRLIDGPALHKQRGETIVGFKASEDGRYVAYQVSEAGSDWRKIRIFDVKNGKDLPDELPWVKFTSISWLGSQGFYYSSYPEPKDKQQAYTAITENSSVRFHALGAKPADDALVFENPAEPRSLMYAMLTDDESTVVISISRSSSQMNLIYLIDRKSGKGRYLIKDWIASFDLIGEDGKTLELPGFSRAVPYAARGCSVKRS